MTNPHRVPRVIENLSEVSTAVVSAALASKGKAARATFYDLSHNEQSIAGSDRALVAKGNGLASNEYT